MSEGRKVSFSIRVFQETISITPALNGTLLTEMVSAFERERRFQPAGGYGGLIPEWFNYGPLDRYLLGDFEQDSYFARTGRIYVLGCECGEVGCWPLLARITLKSDSVIWDSFQQPHRPERDYSCFGPFVFGVHQYRKAVTDACTEFSARIARTK